MKLKKCPCGTYSLKETCKKCGEKTKSVVYKFFGLRNAPKIFKRKN